MKRVLIMVVAVLVPVLGMAQAQITTKKMKLEDFPEKVTKVVLSGNVFLDSELENAVKNRWTVSPYEFCSLEEFGQLKGSDEYYFLMTVLTRFRKEENPGIRMLSLMKGGKGADEGLGKMLEVATIPLCSVDYPSGREMIYLPALLDIMQDHVVASMGRDINAYSGLKIYTSGIAGKKSMRVLVAESDVNKGVGSEFLESLPRHGVEIVSDEVVDSVMTAGVENVMVSYTVCPYDAAPGSYCYKMLIDASTHELYYFRKHKIKAKTGSGFLAKDLNRIASR